MSRWTDSIFNKAYRFYEKGLPEKAFEWFLKGAKAGDTSCMIWVGLLYGDGVKADARNQKEIAWYKRAWKKGASTALLNLAIVYRNQKRFSKAERCFKTAIQDGDGDANLELAKMYISIGRPKKEIENYLAATIDSDYVTEYSIEEAHGLLGKYA